MSMTPRNRNRYKFILRCVQRVRAGQDPFEVFFAQYRRISKSNHLCLTGFDHMQIRMHLLDIATAPNPNAVTDPGWYKI